MPVNKPVEPSVDGRTGARESEEPKKAAVFDVDDDEESFLACRVDWYRAIVSSFALDESERAADKTGIV